MMHTKKASSGVPSNLDNKPKEEKRKSLPIGNTVEEQEEHNKPKDEKPKTIVKKTELVRSESKKKLDENQKDLKSEGLVDDKDDKKEGKGDEEDKDVTNVVDKAKSMEGTLSHRQNAGGANEALQKGDDSIRMNCWDAVLYIVAQAGELKTDIISDTAQKSDEAYKEFQKGENVEMMREESKEDQAFKQIVSKKEGLEAKIKKLETKLEKLQQGKSGYMLLLPVIRNKMAKTVSKELVSLTEELKQIQEEQQTNIKLRESLTKKRVNRELEVRNRPYKDLLKVDEAWDIMHCTKDMNGDDHDIQTVKGKWPPPAGCTIFLTHDNSKCPDFDHVMLSLGGGKCAHLQATTPTPMGLNGLDAGKLKVIDLMEYMKLAAGTSKEWTVKAGPKCWG